ncbi:MAG: hypothetical protein RLZZ171_997 [Cyanobacteriota bacterium]
MLQTLTPSKLNPKNMIDQNLIFCELSQRNSFQSSVELAIALEASVSEVRQVLRNLGDLVEEKDDEWRVIRNISPERLLSFEERQERDALEQTVVQAFYIAGQSLNTLRDKRLYRETHPTFEAYIRDRFAFTRAAAYYLIDAFQVVENLKCQQIVDICKILPTNESQCRPLAKLPPEKQTEAWSKAVELAGNKVPSAKRVKEAIQEICPSEKIGKNKKTNPKFTEIKYDAGVGVEYTVRMNEETFFRLQKYQAKIGSASKGGAVARLLDEIDE